MSTIRPTAEGREAPPAPPPGYTIIEREGKYYPARHDGGYDTRETFSNEGKETKLSGRVIYGPDDIAYETFDRNGEDLSYDHEFPARHWLAKWVRFCGGEHLFHAAWSFYQSWNAPTISLGLEEACMSYGRKAHAYTLIAQLAQDWATGKLTKDTMMMVLGHISSEESGVSEDLRAMYAEACDLFREIPA